MGRSGAATSFGSLCGVTFAQQSTPHYLPCLLLGVKARMAPRAACEAETRHVTGVAKFPRKAGLEAVAIKIIRGRRCGHSRSSARRRSAGHSPQPGLLGRERRSNTAQQISATESRRTKLSATSIAMRPISVGVPGGRLRLDRGSPEVPLGIWSGDFERKRKLQT